MIGQSLRAGDVPSDGLHEAGQPARQRHRARRRAARRGSARRGRGRCRGRKPPRPPPPAEPEVIKKGKKEEEAPRPRPRARRSKSDMLSSHVHGTSSGGWSGQSRSSSMRARRTTSASWCWTGWRNGRGSGSAARIPRPWSVPVRSPEPRAAGQAADLYEPERRCRSGRCMEKNSVAAGKLDRGLRRSRPALDGAADPAARLGRRAPWHGIGHPRDLGPASLRGCGWASIPVRAGRSPNFCSSPSGASSGSNWTNCWTTRPRRSPPSLSEGVEMAMTKFNRRAQGIQSEEE